VVYKIIEGVCVALHVARTAPPAPKPSPQPPTAEQAARIVNESWRDPDWGTLVWTAMPTRVRRGEQCAIRLSLVDLAEGRETYVHLVRAL
jgi:hypothetical protein